MQTQDIWVHEKWDKFTFPKRTIMSRASRQRWDYLLEKFGHDMGNAYRLDPAAHFDQHEYIDWLHENALVENAELDAERAES